VELHLGLVKVYKLLNLSKKLSSNIGKTNAKYGLIKEGDKILIGFSGGKDSTTVLHLVVEMLLEMRNSGEKQSKQVLRTFI